ncbi:nucleotide pyrophosphohydrolase [Nakamurella sp.]|uniref:nucleotide pyrophosphohydrolase n=1 Tax=Nakamurella sp. TaxID=1869182 RepID=UPI0037837014
MEPVIDDTELDGRSGSSRARGQVGDFHRAYGLPIRHEPTAAIGPDQVSLRQALIDEEVRELAEAARAGDVVGVADALADIVYVAYGTAHVYGIDLDAVLDEVHASNMTKLGADGRPVRRADGKVLKGPGYRPPDVRAVLARGAGPRTGVTLDTGEVVVVPAGGTDDTIGDGQEGRPWAEPSPPG